MPISKTCYAHVWPDLAPNRDEVPMRETDSEFELNNDVKLWTAADKDKQ